MTVLAERDRMRAEARRELFAVTRQRLREALHDLAPGHAFWIFGSLVRPGVFNAASDIDIAFTTLPPGVSEFSFGAELEERLGRSVDALDLARTRLRKKIEREGERWIA